MDWARVLWLTTTGTHQSLERPLLPNLSIKSRESTKITDFHWTGEQGRWGRTVSLIQAYDYEFYFSYGAKASRFQSLLRVKRITQGLHHYTGAEWLGQAVTVFHEAIREHCMLQSTFLNHTWLHSDRSGPSERTLIMTAFYVATYQGITPFTWLFKSALTCGHIFTATMDKVGLLLFLRLTKEDEPQGKRE